MPRLGGSAEQCSSRALSLRRRGEPRLPRWLARFAADQTHRTESRSGPRSRSPSVEMPLLVVTEDFVSGPVIQDRKPLDLLNNRVDVAMKFLLVVAARLSALAFHFAAQGAGHRFGDALPAQACEFARQLLSFRVLDVEGHSAFFLFLHLLPNSSKPLVLQHVTQMQRSNVLPAVDVDLGAVYVGARLRAQHVDDLGDFVRRAETMHRNLVRDDILGAGRQDRGVDLAGRNRIDA